MAPGGNLCRTTNDELAIGMVTEPDTITGLLRRVDRAKAERKTTEIRLRQLTTDEGPTEDEIRGLADAIALPAGASHQDRRRVHQAAQLEALRPSAPASATLGLPEGYWWCRRGECNP